MGRPSDYDPIYCVRVVEFLRDGFSLAAFAGELGVARSTVYKWAEEHEEFSDAVKRAQAASALAWEKRLRELATSGEGNPTAIIFGLKNRASDEWRDVKATELSGPGGGPVEVKAEKAEWTIIDTPTPGGA